MKELVEGILRELGGGPEARGARENAGACGGDAALPHIRLPARRRGDPERRGVRRGPLRPDGPGEGHRLLLALRASPAALLRQGARRVHAGPEDPRAVEARAPRRDVQPPTPGPGAADDPG